MSLPPVSNNNFPHIILGLGNPGDEYAQHRHNIGAQCVNLLAKRYGLTLSKTWGNARVAEGRVAERPVVLARSRTFMNQSGLAAAVLLRRTGAPLDRLMVVCDDLDLPLGSTRLRPRGSPGGHNGLASIVEHLGSDEFPRIRIGIGHPYSEEERAARSREQYERDVVRWVLSPFTPDEAPLAQKARERAAEALLCWLQEGIGAAMNRYNQRRPLSEP